MEVSDGASTSKPHSSLAGQQPLLILLTHPNASQLGTWVQGPREKAVVSASNRSPGHEGKYPSSQSDWQDGSLAAAPYDPIHDDAAQFANLPRSVPPCDQDLSWYAYAASPRGASLQATLPECVLTPQFNPQFNSVSLL